MPEIMLERFAVVSTSSSFLSAVLRLYVRLNATTKSQQRHARAIMLLTTCNLRYVARNNQHRRV